MNSFYPIETEDGTLSLFNTEINDVYHSKIGAYTEALNKFIIPSGMIEYSKNNNCVNILDVCFGLGYNSKVAISEIWKVNPGCQINLTAIEIDPSVVALSCFAGFHELNNLCDQAFIDICLNNAGISRYIDEFLNDVSFNEIIPHKTRGYFKDIKKLITDYTKKDIKSSSLHKIYYRTVSIRNKNIQKLGYQSDLLNIDIYICDARDIIQDLKSCYNYIMHDPFTPSKLPTLWSVEFFRELYRLLDYNGNITTYSSSAAVRSGLIESGFYLGITKPIGKKTSGTIAYKNIDLIKDKLSQHENIILSTTAGIPYYDPELKNHSLEILNYREELQKKSDRISSSKYLKSLKQC